MVDAIIASPDDSLETILEKIADGAHEGVDHGDVSFAIQPFAALLIRLSRDADKTAKTVLRLRWGLYFLTVVIALLTLVLVVKEFPEIYEKSNLRSQTTDNNQPPDQGSCADLLTK